MNDQILLGTLRPFVAHATSQFDSIPADRQSILMETADFIRRRIVSGKPNRLTFICTHNSRRSHLAQVWARIAADCYDLRTVETFSGGTEITEINIRTVNTLRRAGLSVVRSVDRENPLFLIQYSDDRPPIRAFSKIFNRDGNPAEDFAAIMCCSNAERNCPTGNGVSVQISLNYRDPKIADDTAAESAAYDERCLQIAIEMFFVMHEAANALAEIEC